MDKRRLLIVDNSEDFPLALSELLQEHYLVQYCLDGKEALSLLQSFRPDILLLELMIPNLDGISLLKAADSLGIHPLILTFTLFYNEYMMTELPKLNVSYWMVKPCDLHATAERIQDLAALSEEQSQSFADPHSQAAELMLSIGFLLKHRGFAYLREAVVMEAHTPGLSVTKNIYPAIAKNFNCSKATAEHSIRTAINGAWEKRNDDIWQQYFVPGPDGTIERPTNAEVITRLARQLRRNK